MNPLPILKLKLIRSIPSLVPCIFFNALVNEPPPQKKCSSGFEKVSGTVQLADVSADARILMRWQAYTDAPVGVLRLVSRMAGVPVDLLVSLPAAIDTYTLRMAYVTHCSTHTLHTNSCVRYTLTHTRRSLPQLPATRTQERARLTPRNAMDQ